MESNKSKLRKQIHAVLIAIAIGSIYFTEIIATLMSPNFSAGDALSPFKHIERLTLEGPELKLYFIIFVVLACVSVGAVYQTWKTNKSNDKMGRNFRHSEYQPYGDSHLEEPEEYKSLAQIRSIEDARGHVLGQLTEDGRQCIDVYPDPKDPTAHINEHIFAIGASGSGKTYTVGKTYCYQSIKMGHSVIHTDPKGELFRDMADIYKKHGYVVRKLNFIEPIKSDGWDCMKPVRTGDTLEKELAAEKFADAVVSQTCDNANSIYYTGPKMLLKALVLRLALDDTIPDDKKNIKTVFQWLSDPAGMDFLDALFDPTAMDDALKPCLPPYNIFRGSSGNLANNLRTNLGAGISVLSTGIVADILSRDDMDLLMPGLRPCAYFVQFAVNSKEFRFPIALFFTMLFQTLMNYGQKSPKGKVNVPVDFFLDEFPNCGVFPSWPENMSTIRSFGLNVFMISQTLGQFKVNYKDSWETIISNCATWIVIGANDQETAEYFSKRIGDTSIEVKTEQHEGIRRLFGIGNSPVDRESSGVGKNALLPSSFIQNLKPNTLLIIFQRHNPIYANAVPNVLHPYFKGSVATSPEDVSNFYDLQTREKEREEERKYIEEYWQTHSIPKQPGNIDDADWFYRISSNPFAMFFEVVKDDIAFLAKRIMELKRKRSAKKGSQVEITEAEEQSPLQTPPEPQPQTQAKTEAPSFGQAPPAWVPPPIRPLDLLDDDIEFDFDDDPLEVDINAYEDTLSLDLPDEDTPLSENNISETNSSNECGTFVPESAKKAVEMGRKSFNFSNSKSKSKDETLTEDISETPQIAPEDLEQIRNASALASPDRKNKVSLDTKEQHRSAPLPAKLKS